MIQATAPPSKSPYRAEVDGLRAIAVVSVLLYHAKFLLPGGDWFEGGYVGVDMFFVISGYLITRIVLSELRERGSFSFLNFYERRARRILPMLLVVILASIPFAWQVLLPPDFAEYAGSILASLLFGSNFFFYYNTTEYGAASSLLTPFLHTWSLGIEEQFYLVFPLAVAIAFRHFRKRLLHMLLALALSSLLFSELMEARNPDLNFYLPFGRFWELLTGSLLAYRELHQRGRCDGFATRLLPAMGLLFIAYSIVSFDGGTPHPSLHTLVPVLGTALVIGFSSNGDPVGRVLGSKPFVWIGLISYSMYLWHYPIFAFSRIGWGEPGNLDKAVWILLTISLSVASYLLVEKPFRRAGVVSRRGLVAAFSSGFCGLAALGALSVGTNGFEDRVPAFLSGVDTSVPIWKSRSVDGDMCYDRVEGFCANQSGGGGVTVYAFGDSHFSSLSEALHQALADEFNYVEANMVGCPFVLGVNRITNGEIDNCSDAYQRRRLRSVSDPSRAVLVLGGRLPLYLSRTWFDNEEGGRERPDLAWPRRFESLDGAEFGDKLVETYRELLDEGHHVVLVYPIPGVGVNVPANLFTRTRGMGPAEVERLLADSPLTTSADVYRRRSKESFELLDRVSHPNLHRVHPHRLFCDFQAEGRCATHDPGGVYYFDDDHPSAYGSKLISDLIYRKVKLAESNIQPTPAPR